MATSVPTVKAAGADSRRSVADMWAVASAIRRARVDRDVLSLRITPMFLSSSAHPGW